MVRFNGAKAHKLLAHEFATTPMTAPASRSTPSHEKMRIYKKGGHVKHHEHEHEKHKHHMHEEHKRAKLHHKEEAELKKIHKQITAEKHLNHGARYLFIIKSIKIMKKMMLAVI